MLSQVRRKRDSLKSLSFSTKSPHLQQHAPTNGQVLYMSHPHLLGPAELMPGMLRDEFRERRSRLLSLVEQGGHGAASPPLVLLVGSRLKYATGPVFYRFQSSTSVLYYTGFDLPDSIVLWSREEYVLFMDPSAHPIFDGTSIEPAMAKETFGFSQVLALDQLGPFLAESSRLDRVWLDMPPANVSLISSPALLESLQTRPSLAAFIDTMRVQKSESEVQLIRKACQAAVPGFIAAMKATRAGVLESQLAHVLRYHMCVPSSVSPSPGGRVAASEPLPLSPILADDFAYEPVVASGRNALVLHYTRNAHVLAANDLVLVDSGALYHGYRSDVSRTWPVNGRFSEPQRALYELVLRTHDACVDRIRVAGERGSKRPSLHALYTLSLQLLYEGLRGLGFHGLGLMDVATLYYPHDVGHYLGLDLHDTPSISKSRPLEPGNVITIEPGLYIPHTLAHGKRVDIPPAFRGLGIRLENDFLVTARGVENLTHDIPIDIEAVEDVMNA